MHHIQPHFKPNKFVAQEELLHTPANCTYLPLSAEGSTIKGKCPDDSSECLFCTIGVVDSVFLSLFQKIIYLPIYMLHKNRLNLGAMWIHYITYENSRNYTSGGSQVSRKKYKNAGQRCRVDN